MGTGEDLSARALSDSQQQIYEHHQHSAAENLLFSTLHSVYEPLRGSAQMINKLPGVHVYDANPFAGKSDPDSAWSKAGMFVGAGIDMYLMSRIAGVRFGQVAGRETAVSVALKAGIVGGSYEFLMPVDNASSETDFWASKAKNTALGVGTFSVMGGTSAIAGKSTLAQQLASRGRVGMIGASTGIGAISGFTGGVVNTVGSDVLGNNSFDLARDAKAIGTFTALGAGFGLIEGITAHGPAQKSELLNQKDPPPKDPEGAAAANFKLPESKEPDNMLRAVSDQTITSDYVPRRDPRLVGSLDAYKGAPAEANRGIQFAEEAQNDLSQLMQRYGLRPNESLETLFRRLSELSDSGIKFKDDNLILLDDNTALMRDGKALRLAFGGEGKPVVVDSGFGSYRAQRSFEGNGMSVDFRGNGFPDFNDGRLRIGSDQFDVRTNGKNLTVKGNPDLDLSGIEREVVARHLQDAGLAESEITTLLQSDHSLPQYAQTSQAREYAQLNPIKTGKRMTALTAQERANLDAVMTDAAKPAEVRAAAANELVRATHDKVANLMTEHELPADAHLSDLFKKMDLGNKGQGEGIQLPGATLYSDGQGNGTIVFRDGRVVNDSWGLRRSYRVQGIEGMSERGADFDAIRKHIRLPGLDKVEIDTHGQVSTRFDRQYELPKLETKLDVRDYADALRAKVASEATVLQRLFDHSKQLVTLGEKFEDGWFIGARETSIFH